MARDKAPEIGRHVACLNLFLEKDGKFYLTVSGHSDMVPFVEMMARDEAVQNPMQALAVMVEEAGPRFVETWREWERG